MPVSRRAYFVHGLGLMIFKYGLDASAYGYVNKALLNPLQFLDPVLLHRAAWFSDTEPMRWIVVLYTLPFIWIGLSLSMRRAIDAGGTGALGLLFICPYINYVCMAILVQIPSRPRLTSSLLNPLERRTTQLRKDRQPIAPMNQLMAILATIGVTIPLAIFSILTINSYGSSLFVALPVFMGFVHAVVLNKNGDVGLGRTIVAGQSMVIVSMLCTMLFALEGVICLLMAWPLVAGLVIFGSIFGRLFVSLFKGRSASGPSAIVVLVLLMPFIAWQESRLIKPHAYEVISMVEVNAPPSVVWKNVVSFPDLPPPSGIFATGIACPLRARIEGTGVGAVRYCEFTTGPFIEPITVWDEPRRLAFNVTTQPPPMRELSPFHVQAPHLDGYLQSQRGEFRLVPLDGGRRTRLEGSTWYTVDVHPGMYWRWWSDGLIHAIHVRVLDHIKSLSEDLYLSELNKPQ